MLRGGGSGKGTTMDPYTLTKNLEYTQQELARARGHRNWTRIFDLHRKGR